jgi:DNA-binding PadR family transcriptional regulator
VKLAPLDHAVLVVIATSDRGLSFYDLKRQVSDSTAPLLGAGISSVRTSLKMLADNQFLEAHEVEASELRPGERASTRYTVTLRGRTALEDWAAAEPMWPNVAVTELQTRIRALPVVGLEPTLDALYQVDLVLSQALGLLEPPALAAGGEVAVRLEHDLLHGLYWCYLQWLDRAIRELGGLARAERLESGGDVERDDLQRRISRHTLSVRARLGDEPSLNPRAIRKRRTR